MRVLVVAASRHGATEQIAAEIAKTLRYTLSAQFPGAFVDLRSAEQVATLTGYDAVVLGSAVYMGRWLPAAREFAERNAGALAAVAAAVGAREHRTFTGQLDRHRLGLVERAVVRAVHAPDGDFRDWPAIRDWAAGIGSALRATPQ